MVLVSSDGQQKPFERESVFVAWHHDINKSRPIPIVKLLIRFYNLIANDVSIIKPVSMTVTYFDPFMHYLITF